MRPIDHHVQFMTPHTQDRIKNSITPHNLMLDPMIKNDPQVMNDLRIHVPGFGQPGSQSSAFITGRRQAGHRQMTSQIDPEAAKILLTVFSISVMVVLLSVMVVRIGEIYTLYIADMLSASPTINLGPFVATLTEIITSVTFSNIVTVAASVFNSGPAMLAITTVTFLIIRNHYIKQIATLQRRADIMDRYIDENLGYDSKITQQPAQVIKDAAESPETKEIETQAVQLEETSIVKTGKTTAPPRKLK